MNYSGTGSGGRSYPSQSGPLFSSQNRPLLFPSQNGPSPPSQNGFLFSSQNRPFFPSLFGSNLGLINANNNTNTLPKAQKDQNAPSQDPKYRVDNWQIPVPIGDASAHFLIDNSQGHTVINAFIMDGGDDNGPKETAWSSISEALKVIDIQYGISWCFDAIVITHHDSDHYVGLKTLLDQEVMRGTDYGSYMALYFSNGFTVYSGGKEARHISWDIEGTKGTILGEDGIGIDIFSKTRMFLGQLNPPSEKGDADEGIGRFDKKDNRAWKRPRFVIVGSNGYAADGERTADKGLTKNQTSILAILYWPSKGGKSSYYTGGDGNPRLVTGHIVKWMHAMESDVPETIYPRLPIDMVKLDHHGSLLEQLTEKYFVDAFEAPLFLLKPVQVLVTPGHKHGHPNWAVLEMVGRYFNGLDSARGKPRLYTTRSPYWMVKKWPGGNEINTKHGSLSKVQLILPKDADAPERLYLGDGYDLPGDYSSFDGTIDLDDKAINHDTVFFDETLEFAGDDVEMKRLRSVYATDKYWFDDPKTGQKKLNGKLFAKERKADLNALKNAGKVYQQFKTKNDRYQEEGDVNAYMIKVLELAEKRRMIVDHAMLTWDAISDQPLCQADKPYFLIFFSVQDGGPPVVKADMDERGHIKDPGVPKEDPVQIEQVAGWQPRTEKELEDLQTLHERYAVMREQGEMTDTDRDAERMLIDDELARDDADVIQQVTRTDKDGNKKVKTYKFANESHRLLCYIYEEMARLGGYNYPLLNHFVGSRLLEGIHVVANHTEDGDQIHEPGHDFYLPLNELKKEYGYNNYGDENEYKFNKDTFYRDALENRPPGLTNVMNFNIATPQTIDLSSLKDYPIKNLFTGESLEFSGDVVELLRFEAFVQIYTPTFNLSNKTNTREKKRGSGMMTEKVSKEKVTLLKAQWLKLVRRAAELAQQQYQAAHKIDYANAKAHSEQNNRGFRSYLQHRNIRPKERHENLKKFLTRNGRDEEAIEEDEEVIQVDDLNSEKKVKRDDPAE